MSRMPPFSNPLLLGFDEIERLVERAAKGAAGYPPYNIERIGKQHEQAVQLRITLAVAGFAREDLALTVEDKQLVIRGNQRNGKARDFLFQGIASRDFSRTFVLADGMEIEAAELNNGLLTIDLVRVEPRRLARRIEIGAVARKD